MSASFVPVDISEKSLSSPEEALAELARQGVTYGVNADTVREAFTLADPPADIVVAQGIRAKDGKDGGLKFVVDVSAKPQFVPENDGIIDFRKSMRVALVGKDQKVADILPPTQGEPGSNIMGGTIAPIAGMSARFSLGEGIEQRGAALYATCSGTPSNKGGHVAIRQIYEVPGDVDFKVGSILFPGSVVVDGNVIDGFEIQSDEDVVVRGTVSACRIIAKRNIQVLGGILGQGKSEIRAGGFIEAKFCDAADLIAEGDIVITKDSLNSRMATLGCITVGGSIVGGEALALHSVEAREIGTSKGTRTLVQVHKHYRQEKARELSDQVLSEANAMLERIRRWSITEILPEAELERLEADLKGYPALVQRKKNADTQIEKLDAQLLEIKDAKVRAIACFHPEVTLGAPHCKTKLVDPVKGPSSAVENINTGNMDFKHG